MRATARKRSIVALQSCTQIVKNRNDGIFLILMVAATHADFPKPLFTADRS
jgi:hypothetical protein